MARLPRPDIAGIPQHIVQRGNNRLPCFLDDGDRRRYLHGLHECLRRFDCALHAYVLMSNHVHLLITPAECGAVSRMMQTFGRNYVHLFNGRHRRTGTLWEGRFKSCLVESDQYVLSCFRYIELNPVRAWMVDSPSSYIWSSHLGNIGHRVDELLTPHPSWLSLGSDLPSRVAGYRRLFDEAMSDEILSAIRIYLQQQRVLGTNAFQRRVEATLGRFSAVRPAHRPKKSL